MDTSINNRTTRLSRDPMYYLAQEMRIRNFSPKTVKSYLYYNKEMLRFANKFANEINKQDIRDYLDFLVSYKKSASTLNVAINALKFYYQGILHRKFFDFEMGIKRPKEPKKLPVVLSKEEVVKMIEATDNIKHKLVIQILYCSGLRISELVDLKINDIDFQRKSVMVKSGKGKKDRITIISKIVLDNVSKYLAEYRPLVYLFESYKAGNKINVRSAQKIVTDSAVRAGIAKEVSAHSLRHTFATHLLEDNVNLRYIQSLLGHARLETTQIYTKVAVNKFNEIKDLLEYE